jgi:hypothetical protein
MFVNLVKQICVAENYEKYLWGSLHSFTGYKLVIVTKKLGLVGRMLMCVL